MSSESLRRNDYLSDIVEAATAIEEFVNGLSFDEFAANKQVKWAVERGLMIASEAVIRLDNAENRERYPGIDWRNCRGLGNVIRHDYNVISDQTIWKIVHEDLPKLKAIAQAAIAE